MSMNLDELTSPIRHLQAAYDDLSYASMKLIILRLEQ